MALMIGAAEVLETIVAVGNLDMMSCAKDILLIWEGPKEVNAHLLPCNACRLMRCYWFFRSFAGEPLARFTLGHFFLH